MIVRRGSYFIILFVIAVAWWQREALNPSAWLTFLSRAHGPSLNATRRSQTFVLPPERWVEFPLPSFAIGVRIVTNASVSNLSDQPPRSGNGRDGWLYQMEYEYLDSQSAILDRGIYHFRTGITTYQSYSTGEVIGDKFFVPSDLVPCDSQTMASDLLPWNHACRTLRLRVKQTSEQIQDISVRVYFQCERAKGNSHYTWYRLSRDTRDSLCRGMVYPQELTTLEERHNLLRWQWSPSHPRGIEGEDYQRRLLYYVDNVQGEILDDADFLAGDVVAPDTNLSVPIPVQGGNVQLDFDPLLSTSQQRNPILVTGLWYGKNREERALSWKIEQPISHSVSLPPGLLVLNANHSISIRPLWYPPAELRSEIQDQQLPTSQPLTAYEVQPSDPVEFKITHVDDTHTPFRITVRRAVSTEDRNALTETPCEVRWYALDVDNHPVAKGTLAPDQQCSPFDLLSRDTQNERVSEPKDYYFDLPPSVTRMRFTVDQHPLLVNAFTRPNDLPRIISIPEDYGFNPITPSYHRSWFVIQPVDFPDRLQMDRCLRLLISRRHEAMDDFEQLEEYTWESFTPDDAWRGRELLVPQEPLVVEREESLDSRFYGVPTNEDVALELVAPELQGVPDCHLIYVRTTSGVGRLALHLDGERFHETSLHASRGEIALPPLPPPYGVKRTMRIETDRSTQVYLRHVQVSDTATYMKRTAVRFDGTAKEFVVHKKSHDTEVVRMHVYRTPNRQRCRITAELGPVDEPSTSSNSPALETPPIAPRSDWTIRARVFDIAPTSDQVVRVLGTTSELAANQVTCFIPLGQDLPPGDYRIRVSGDDQSHGYLVLYRIQPGKSPQRRISSEFATHPLDAPGTVVEGLTLHPLTQ